MFTYWVARDQDGSMYLFEGKSPPKRDETLSKGVWIGETDAIPVDESLFPFLKWEDEPIKVTLFITPRLF